MSYIKIAPPRCWLDALRYSPTIHGEPVYLFRNLRGIKPGRWGIGFFGLFEVGSRNPGDPVGVRLKKCGLWPW